MGDFIEELQDRGYIRFNEEQTLMVPTSKTDRSIREKSLHEIFRQLKKADRVSIKRLTPAVD